MTMHHINIQEVSKDPLSLRQVYLSDDPMHFSSFFPRSGQDRIRAEHRGEEVHVGPHTAPATRHISPSAPSSHQSLFICPGPSVTR